MDQDDFHEVRFRTPRFLTSLRISLHAGPRRAGSSPGFPTLYESKVNPFRSDGSFKPLTRGWTSIARYRVRRPINTPSSNRTLSLRVTYRPPLLSTMSSG